MHACALGQAALRQKPRSSLGTDGSWVAHLCLRARPGAEDKGSDSERPVGSFRCRAGARPWTNLFTCAS